MKINKKGQVLANLGGLGIGIATLTILMAVMFLVTSQTQDQIADINNAGTVGNDNSTAMNATHTLINAAADIPGWVPLIVIVVIGGIILGMVKVFGR